MFLTIYGVEKSQCDHSICLVYAKNRQVMFRSVFCDFQRWKIRSVSSDPLAVSSVAGTFEVLSFVTVLFVLQINNQLDYGDMEILILS